MFCPPAATVRNRQCPPGQGRRREPAGADSTAGSAATIVAVQGAGGRASWRDGAFRFSGQYGALSIDTHGNFNYVRNAGTPDGVRDVFQYTLADASGTNASTTLTIDIAQVAAAAAGQTDGGAAGRASSCPTSTSMAATSSSTCPTARRW